MGQQSPMNRVGEHLISLTSLLIFGMLTLTLLIGQVIGLSYGIEERDLWSELVTGREVMVLVVALLLKEPGTAFLAFLLPQSDTGPPRDSVKQPDDSSRQVS